MGGGYNNALSFIDLYAMKIRHFFIIPACALCLAFSASPSFAGKIGKDCTYKGKNLYGKVQVVDAFPDFRVSVVSAFGDLNVQRVDAFANSCGRWQFVDAFPDFKVQFVDAFSDFDIQYVDAFPGVR